MRYLNAEERAHAKKTLYVEVPKWITQLILIKMSEKLFYIPQYN
jgi:hypothetical protein